MTRRDLPLTPYIGAHTAAGAASGLVVVVGVATHAGTGPPAPLDLLIGVGVGLAIGAALAPVGAWIGAGRRITRALPALLFPPMLACFLLGRYANHGLTITAALVAYLLALVGVAFFMRRAALLADSTMRCPKCAATVDETASRCPHCAVQLSDVSAGSSSSLPASSSTRSA